MLLACMEKTISLPVYNMPEQTIFLVCIYIHKVAFRVCVDKKSSEFGHQDATDTPQNETVPVYSVECILYKCTVIIEGSIDLNDAQLLLSFC